MPLVKVLADETEQELRETLRQLQILIASSQEAIQRIDRIGDRFEQALAALMTAGHKP